MSINKYYRAICESLYSTEYIKQASFHLISLKNQKVIPTNTINQIASISQMVYIVNVNNEQINEKII